MLWPYLKIWERELIFGRAVKVISLPGVRSPWYVLYYVHIHSGLWTVRERYSCQNLLENAVRIPRPPRPPWITYQACLNLNDMDSFNRKLVKDINSSMDYTLATTTCRSLAGFSKLAYPCPKVIFLLLFRKPLTQQKI